LKFVRDLVETRVMARLCKGSEGVYQVVDAVFPELVLLVASARE
jgi:hypothetical protein